MKGKKVRTAAVVLAVSSMAGEAWAEAVCAGAQDLTALQVASVQQQLMVAALSCEADDVTLYNSFVTTYQQELVASDEALQAYFVRRTPASGIDDYNSYKTKLANNYSLSSGGDRPGFCRRADTLFHDALTGRKKSLAAFVLAQPMLIEADYTVCGDSVKGESYAYAAVKEEPRYEAPTPAPAVTAAAPPPIEEPKAPAIAPARNDANDRSYAENQPPAAANPVPSAPSYGSGYQAQARNDANDRSYAENLPPVAANPVPAAPSYGYGYQAQQPQSTCTRMSSGYLDCYYGDFHYYRDPYGRYLPPPRSYRRSY